MSRLLVLGDIHGCDTALRTLIDFVPIKPRDFVIGLGDYVDRGPNSRGVVQWLIDRFATGRLIPLRGNHEIMMLDARVGEDLYDGWLKSGGRFTLASYGMPDQPGSLAEVPATHWQFLQNSTRRYYETDTHFFVHANVIPEWPLCDQPDDALFWEKFRDPPPHESGKIMICGHTPQPSLVPRDIGHAVCIDTWVYKGGFLTCLEPETGRYWQASQTGETRRNWLERV